MHLLRSRPAPRGASSTRTACLRAVAGVGVAATVAGLATAGGLVTAGPAAAAPAEVAPGAAAATEPASRFTLAVLPDTQFYSRYAESEFERPDRYGDGNNPFAVQTEWLAEHADELRIPFVAHLGDVVDQVNQEGEWRTADAAMQTLDDADLPYSVLAGNHDVRNSASNWFDDQYDLAAEPFLRWFGPDRAAEQSTYGGSDPTGMNQYHVFEAEGQQFMVLALSWRASDATLRWADEVMAQHPTVPVILTSHDIIGIQDDGVSPQETGYGLRLWDQLIRSNDQIFMTLNGHFHGATQLVKQNDAGHPVTQVLMDYQMAYEGGNGYLGLFEFDLTNDTISVQTGSPWVVAKPQEKLTSYDQAFLEGPNQQFTLDIDFEQRFAGFNPAFTAGSADEPSLTQAARDILLDGFVAPDPITTSLPGSTTDYPVVEGTLAHWRMNGRNGVVAQGGVIRDVAGNNRNNLMRVPIAQSGSPTAQLGDVRFTDDANPFSSDGAAVCFANSSKQTDRYSYLTTRSDAPVNTAALADGYTIETFLKIDESWTQSDNAWMKAIVRSGNRSEIGVPRTRWDWTASPVALGLSNLKEFQWTEVPIDTAKGDRTAWSGEIMVDTWVHVAVVNDPATATTTMYVDGAPVLRNASNTVGHGLDGAMPWLFGADWVDDQATNGWNGCIGETRVVDHPIGQDEWLTARVDLDGLTVTTPAPDATLSRTVTASGTGTPGATVTVEANIDRRVTVGADGVWRANLGTLRPGTHELVARQSMGDRSADPVTVSFTVSGR
ncbi:metallophosphoesterase [Modestobacter sp. VKM Ac-2983]|uniref:LamG-like jellyroll fold domain-containing protein n=1 Tax=Modestobacter sp. VKM Ac-2983 TaxID=3004137 RepID=UPI0022AB7542|nr:LamG-like jellyroll fold domain-containing protein [Modestobacter sp. VKM Ac-2983]MCZ2804594.1 metallophosphoesterase [Modestobacter sp. VKM Ac-2983]